MKKNIKDKKMKKIVFFLALILGITSCDSVDSPDCFQRTGTIVSKEVIIEEFTRILVNPNVEMILKEGVETKIVIESGENLIDEVTAEVIDERLILSNTNDCNFVRSFNQTKIYVTAPNITEIRSATQFDISSDGVLTYPSLSLLSEDIGENTGSTNGTFHLDVDNENINVVGNNIATFFISGKVNTLTVTLASGPGRFEGRDLLANEIQLFHRGSNKVIIHPLQSLRGELRSTGDVISVNRPDVVAVEEFFTGRLIFE